MSARNACAALSRPNGFKPDEMRSKVNDAIPDVEFKLLDISSLLQDADKSPLTKSKNWESALRPAIDAVQAEANGLAKPKISDVDLGAGLASIRIKIEALNTAVRDRLAQEVRRHLPS